jgi:hypothetical protein
MTQEMRRLTLDGETYDLSSLSQTALDTLVSLQFVETRLQQLQGEMAVSQTAHVTYARALKAELEQRAAAETT